MAEITGFLALILVTFCVVLVICWVVLPFALIGTKPILRELLEEVKRTNELLSRERAP